LNFGAFYFWVEKKIRKINFDSVNRVERASQLFCEEGKRTNNNKVVVHLGVG
jgi:diaminopimelate decarboxylase